MNEIIFPRYTEALGRSLESASASGSNLEFCSPQGAFYFKGESALGT